MNAFSFDVLEGPRSSIKVFHTVKDCTQFLRKCPLFATYSRLVDRRRLSPPTAPPMAPFRSASDGNAHLDAYDAANVSNSLFSGPAIGSRASGVAVKFKVPTVANG